MKAYNAGPGRRDVTIPLRIKTDYCPTRICTSPNAIRFLESEQRRYITHNRGCEGDLRVSRNRRDPPELHSLRLDLLQAMVTYPVPL